MIVIYSWLMEDMLEQTCVYADYTCAFPTWNFVRTKKEDLTADKLFDSNL